MAIIFDTSAPPHPLTQSEISKIRKPRGFAVMAPEKQREIASRGGKVAHAKGAAHEFTPAEASAAARSGHAKGTAHKFTHAEAKEAGRKGGFARAERARAANGSMK
jgi:general stress protein YciG